MKWWLVAASLLVGCAPTKKAVEPVISSSGWTLNCDTMHPGSEVIGAYRGDGKSPPLRWDLPSGKPASVVLVVEDVNSPGDEPFVHWLVAGLPARGSLPEGLVPPPAIVGVNSLGNARYFGPNPPEGTHEYHFRLYALAKDPGLKPGFNRSQLEAAMKGHVVDQTELVFVATAKG